MFGNRAKISAEELAYMKEQLDNDRGFFENVNAKSKLIEADFDELEKSRQLEESSLKQLNDNVNNVVEFSKDSMDAISALNDSFTECVKAAADNLTSLEGAAKAIDLTLSTEECAWLEELYTPHPLVGVMAQNTAAAAKGNHVWSTGNQKI